MPEIPRLDKETQLARVSEGIRNLFADPLGHTQSQIVRAFTDPSMQALPMGMGFSYGPLSKFSGIVNALSGSSALPTTKNIASWTGGIHAGGPGGEAARLGSKYSVADIARMMETDPAKAEQVGDAIMRHYNQGARRITSDEFLPTWRDTNMLDFASTNQSINPKYITLHGGMVPHKDVWDRVMNAGLRDIILGFGK